MGDPVTTPATFKFRELSAAIFDRLEDMEREADTYPECQKYRSRTGLLCYAEYSNRTRNHVENAITRGIARRFSFATDQVRGYGGSGKQPDIVFKFADGIEAVLEAKPVYQRWITDGSTIYRSVNPEYESGEPMSANA